MPAGSFQDRSHAGRLLAEKLGQYAGRQDVLVLALPRGGVAVGFEIARALRLPLDVFVVRKLGVPGHEELAMGAVATGNVRVLQRNVIQALGIPSQVIEAVTEREVEELARRELAYRGLRPAPVVEGRTVILVDDGLATGSTMHAAVQALKRQTPARIVIAVPVAAPEICEQFRDKVDEIVCLETPEDLDGVGLWYQDFTQLNDDDVRSYLHRIESSAWQQFTGLHTRGQIKR
jgi:predicted phosphoribosyltransferase